MPINSEYLSKNHTAQFYGKTFLKGPPRPTKYRKLELKLIC